MTEVAMIIDTAIWGDSVPHTPSEWINTCAQAVVEHVSTALDVYLSENPDG